MRGQKFKRGILFLLLLCVIALMVGCNNEYVMNDEQQKIHDEFQEEIGSMLDEHNPFKDDEDNEDNTTIKDTENDLEEAVQIILDTTDMKVNEDISGTFDKLDEGTGYSISYTEIFEFTINTKGKLMFDNMPETMVKEYDYYLYNKGNYDESINIEESSWTRVPAGTYYLKLTAKDMVNYKFNINYEAETSEDIETEFNNSEETANLIETDRKITGNLNDYNDEDYFKITLNEQTVVQLEVTHEKGRFNVAMKESGGMTFLNGESSGGSFEKKNLPAGEYYVIVSSNANEYSNIHFTREDYQFIIHTS